METGSNAPSPNERKTEPAAEKGTSVLCIVAAFCFFIFSGKSLLYAGIGLILTGLFFFFYEAGSTFNTGIEAKKRASSGLAEDIQKKNKQAALAEITGTIMGTFVMYAMICSLLSAPFIIADNTTCAIIGLMIITVGAVLWLLSIYGLIRKTLKQSRTDPTYYLRMGEAAQKTKDAAPPAPKMPKAEHMSDADYVRAIKRANDLIPDKAISDDIAHIESLTLEICKYAPEGKDTASTQKFFSYYLPMLLKLLQMYIDFDNKIIQTPVVAETKTTIAAAIKKIKEAFASLYDNLISSAAFDIETDIAALENMLNLDGLLKSLDINDVMADNGSEGGAKE